MTREKLIEVIRNALWRASFAPHEDLAIIERQKAEWAEDWDRTLPKATAALAALEAAGVRLVSFAALAEDEAAVERVARAMLADELNVRPTLTFAPTWEQESDIWLSNARAAIRAMGE